jgi:hypothetical protein
MHTATYRMAKKMANIAIMNPMRIQAGVLRALTVPAGHLLSGGHLMGVTSPAGQKLPYIIHTQTYKV